MARTTPLIFRHLGEGIREGIREDMGTGADGQAEILAAMAEEEVVVAEEVK